MVKDKLKICVKDNGFGIAAKEQKHIFDNFERGDKVQGKGIDWFWNWVELCEQSSESTQKDSITVESEDGLGSNFIITLPLK